MNQELENLLREYEDRFEAVFPMFPLGFGQESEVSNMIRMCLSEGKNAYEMGFVPPLDDNTLY